MKNEIRSVIILASMFLVSSHAFSQQNNANTSSKKTNEPTVLFQVSPLYFELGNNVVFGYGLQADGFIGKRLSYTAAYYGSYYDYNKDAGNDPTISDSYQGIKSSKTLIGNIHFHIYDKMVNGKVKLNNLIKSESVEVEGKPAVKSTYQLYNERGFVRRIVALRGGLYNYLGGIRPKDADSWPLIPISVGVAATAAGRSNFTNLHSLNLSAGLSTGKLIISSGSYRNMYADVLYNISSKLDNFKSSSDKMYSFQWGGGTLQNQPIGWRMGYEQIYFHSKLNFAARFEAGRRPAIKGQGAYFIVGFGICPYFPMWKK